VKLGIVTYNIAAAWDLPTIISVCEEIGLQGVELRTTHAHGVEVGLSPAERQDVRKRVEDSAIELAGLGSAFEYHSPDPDELKKNIDGSKEYAKLAADVGAPGIKVRPNNIPEDVPLEKTLEQIGTSLREVGSFAGDLGVEIRLEVHGRKSCHVPYIAEMLRIADHPNVKACWNSNPADADDTGDIAGHFGMLAQKIGLVHINVLTSGYPYRHLFQLLRNSGYKGFTLAEIPGCPDLDSAKVLLGYYKALWNELQP
jgi:sugar phosphate isomerase/epimerase